MKIRKKGCPIRYPDSLDQSRGSTNHYNSTYQHQCTAESPCQTRRVSFRIRRAYLNDVILSSLGFERLATSDLSTFPRIRPRRRTQPVGTHGLIARRDGQQSRSFYSQISTPLGASNQRPSSAAPVRPHHPIYVGSRQETVWKRTTTRSIVIPATEIQHLYCGNLRSPLNARFVCTPAAGAYWAEYSLHAYCCKEEKALTHIFLFCLFLGGSMLKMGWHDL
ncbi:hypothetical protein LY76DRAFT_280771 [Colletotrichum caudatum]|nr:hypothetical protein LY76DRAFT_280771 [Colletotrichum caudatum]